MLAAVGGLVIVAATEVRRAEARLVGVLASVVLGRPPTLAAWGPVVFWSGPHGELRAVEVTSSCASGRVVAPLLVAVGLLTIGDRVRPVRAVAGAATTTGLLVVVNQARLVLVAWMVDRHGTGAPLAVTHALVGPLLTVFGVALCVGLGAIVAFGGRRRVAQERPATPGRDECHGNVLVRAVGSDG